MPSFEYIFGFFISLLIHVGLGLGFFIYITFYKAPPAKSTPIYSVTLEGGQKLGGISQAPKDDQAKSPKSHQKAPPEQAPEAVQEQQEQEEQKAAEIATKALEVKKKAEEKKKKAELEKKRKEKLKAEKLKKEKQKKAREKKEQEQRRKLEERLRKEEAEKKRKQREEEAKRRSAEEKKRKAEQKAKRRRERENRLQEAVRKASEDSYQGESANAGGEGFGAAKIGKPGSKGMGGGVLVDGEFIAYSNALESHIHRGFRWSFGGSLEAVIEANISPRGEIYPGEAKLIKSSGNANYDDAALRAVYKSSPVPPAPKHLYHKYFKRVVITLKPN